MKYEGVSKMSETSMLEAVKNCLIRKPKVGIALGLASNNFICIIKHRVMCRMVLQRLYLGSILQR